MGNFFRNHPQAPGVIGILVIGLTPFVLYFRPLLFTWEVAIGLVLFLLIALVVITWQVHKRRDLERQHQSWKDWNAGVTKGDQHYYTAHR